MWSEIPSTESRTIWQVVIQPLPNGEPSDSQSSLISFKKKKNFHCLKELPYLNWHPHCNFCPLVLSYFYTPKLPQLLILFNLLCLGSPCHRLQVRSSRSFWCLPPVGEVGSVACIGFLVERTGACVLLGEAVSCPSGGQGCVQWCVLECLWT